MRQIDKYQQYTENFGLQFELFINEEEAIIFSIFLDQHEFYKKLVNNLDRENSTAEYSLNNSADIEGIVKKSIEDIKS